MKKKVLSILLAVLMVVSLLPMTAWAATPLTYDGTADFAAVFSEADVTVTFNDGGAKVVATNSDKQTASLTFFFSSGDKIPAGTYPINDTKSPDTVLASKGVDGGMLTDSKAGNINDQGQFLAPAWFIVDGSVTVSYEGTTMKIVVNGLNSNGQNVALTITKTTTVADVLKTVDDFPIEPGGWTNENKASVFADADSLYAEGESFGNYVLDKKSKLTKSGDNYTFTDGDGATITFVMADGKLDQITIAGMTGENEKLNGTYTVPATEYIYLNTGGSSLWNKDGATFVVWTWGGSLGSDVAVPMELESGDIYKVDKSLLGESVLFVRVVSGKTFNGEDWSTDTVWNKTGDVNVPASSDNCYEITGWGDNDGQWTVYTPAAVSAITNGTAEGDKETNHGYIAVDETAAEGETVTITVKQNEGYQLKSLTYVPTSAVPAGFVDLGITAADGTPLYWAECNLGASQAEECGYYYMWGGTTGYTYKDTKWVNAETSVELSDGFSLANAPYYESSAYTKYTGSDYGILQSADDAATTENSNWRIPTIAEFQALLDKCYLEWTDNYKGSNVKGVIVYRAEKNEDAGKYNGQEGYTTSNTHIFLPAAGRGQGEILTLANENAMYWSSTLGSRTVPQNASFFGGSNSVGDAYDSGISRYYGFSIRPVTTSSDPEITPAKQQDGTYQFTMPGYAVTVTAEFEAAAPAPTPEMPENVEVKDGKIKSGDSVVEVKTVGGTKISSDKLQDVAEAINNTLDNKAVSEFTKSGLDGATGKNDDAFKSALKALTQDKTAQENLENAKLTKRLELELKGTEVSDLEDPIVEKMTVVVTPVAIAKVEGSDDEVELKTTINDSDIEEKITVRMPVDSKNDSKTAAVYDKNGKFLGNFEVKEENGNKFIEFSTQSCGEFTYLALNDNTAKAKIGTKLYAKAADALSEITDGQTITLTQDVKEPITVSKACTFTVNDNGYNVEIVAGSGYKLTKDGNTYTITKKSSGNGSGSSSYAVELPESVKNGKIEVSPKNASEGQTVTLTVTPDEGFTLEKLTVLDKNGKQIEVKNLGNNKYSFTMPSGKVTVSAIFTEVKTVCPQDETCVYAKFTDADTKAWYHDGVHFCVENGYMQGISTDKFAPTGTLSRAMIITMLWRLEGEPVVNYAMSFKDAADGQWYTEAIRWAQSNKIVEGFSADSFGPDNDVTREQLAAILYRYAKYHEIDVATANTLAGFTDANKVSTWALDAMKWANAVGIINGRTTTTIVPTGNATRAEAANMVQRFCEAFQK